MRTTILLSSRAFPAARRCRVAATGEASRRGPRGSAWLAAAGQGLVATLLAVGGLTVAPTLARTQPPPSGTAGSPAAAAAVAAPSPAPALGKEVAPGAVLRVEGDLLDQPRELSAAAWAQLPRRQLRVAEKPGGPENVFEGVALTEVLRWAGLRFDGQMRRAILAAALVVEGADGYRVVFSVPELDPALTDREPALVADRRDGQPLGGNEAPYRLVVPGEKQRARWVRQVVALRLHHF